MATALLFSHIHRHVLAMVGHIALLLEKFLLFDAIYTKPSEESRYTEIGEREAVGWLDTQYHRTCAPPWFMWDKLYLNLFIAQKMQNEVAYLVISDRCQECWTQPQTLCAHADVGWATSHIGGEVADLLERSANIVGVKIYRRPPHSDHIV
jgi:hypothetical protein